MLVLGAFSALERLRSVLVYRPSPVGECLDESLTLRDCRWMLGLMVALFVSCIPYLLSYWPGLVFGDTVGSLSQVVNATGLE